jgi:dipeptidyl aminopeptidase/acylaminoacyl peptidase
MSATPSRDSRAITTDPPPPAADVRLTYGSGPLQFGDLRLPEGEGPHPLAVVVHGGFWRANFSLIAIGHLCHALARAGVATWNLEYRRIGDPGGGWPGTFDDVARGVEHAPRLADAHRLDLDRVIVFGHSAGGQLALWAARRIRVRAAVSLAGVVDLVEASHRGLGLGATDQLMGGAPEDVPDRYASGSPAAQLPLGVRQVLVHGTADQVVPLDLSERYVERARELGDDAKLVAFDAIGHFEPIDPQTHVFDRMLELLVAELRSW